MAESNQKPVDRWLGIFGVVVGILFYLVPTKTPIVVVGSLILIFVLLIHPIWNFWWIENSVTRRVTALLALAALTILVGMAIWPEPIQQAKEIEPNSSTPKQETGLSKKELQDNIQEALSRFWKSEPSREHTKSEPTKPKAEQKLTESQRRKPPLHLTLTFKNSPLFTPVRKERIASEMEAFYYYLVGIGFDVPKEIPPLGTRPGNAIGMSWTAPLESIYDAQIGIPEQWLDKPDDIRNVYALWAFRKLFGIIDDVGVGSAWKPTTASLFSCYYRSSFVNRNVCDHDWQGHHWNNILWEVRQKKGQEFTDRAMLYTYKAWKKPSKDDEAFDTLFGNRFLRGVLIIDNRGKDYEDVASIMRAHNQ